MIIALSLVLIVLQKVHGYEGRDVEVVLLPLWNAERLLEVPLAFKVFGELIELDLRRNDKIVTPHFQVWKYNPEGGITELSELSKPISCHYLHKNDISSAAISLCQETGMHGLIFLKNVTLEIMPIQSSDLFSDITLSNYILEDQEVFGEPHIIKRAYSSIINEIDQPEKNPYKEIDLSWLSPSNKLHPKFKFYQNEENLTLELGVFFDQPAYELFSPFFNRKDEHIRDMLLAYVNGIQALYHHPSLGVRLDISLVRLDIMAKQPVDLPHYDGERGALLNSFCNYAKIRNPPDDRNPKHWDMSLYVSGLDFYAFENGQKNSATMGLAAVGGVCYDEYSCVIAELGVTNHFGKPYPSAGFTSVYIAAHEIGHNLGMHHDSTDNSCPKDGYIMSPSRGTHGETVWSKCSRDVAIGLSRAKSCLLDQSKLQGEKSFDHSKFLDLPGREWTAKKQCELLLRDKDATVVTLYQACQSLQCKSPHRSGYYYAGPALDGTNCAPGKECQGGQCLPVRNVPASDSTIKEGSWSSWKLGPCSSGCLQKSTGYQVRRRFCNNPNPENTDAGCNGPHYDVVLCKDEKLCKKKKRKTIIDFATIRCTEFSKKLPELDEEGGGLQALHEPLRPWMACAIFCRRKDIASYYTPRVELNDLGLDPYFPDGTWCHSEGGLDYFCRQHHCLPENFRFGKKLQRERNDYLELGPQNARPGEPKITDDLMKYLSLGPDGLPLMTSLPFDIASLPDEDEWIDKDYIELPVPDQEILF